MPVHPWKRPLGTVLPGVAVVGTVGLLTGYWLEPLAAVLAVYVAWHMVNGWRLIRWLDEGDGELPGGRGLWAAVFDRIRHHESPGKEQNTPRERSASEFQDVTDALPDAIVLIDDRNTITWFNESASGILGLRNPEDLGRPVTHLLRDPDFADWIAVQDQLESHYEMPCPHNERVHLSASAVRFGESRRLLLFSDITDVHNLERIRQDFVANVSHELRTPLTVLLGYLETLSDQPPDGTKQALDSMQEKARQMQTLLDDLLTLSQLQSHERTGTEEAVDVPALLMALKEQAEELSRGRHTLRFEIQPGLGLTGIRADLESAFRNLVSNAIHYTPEPGTITVRWELADDGPVLSVIDTGIGIPSREIPRLTERFYRVGSGRARHAGGTGLGLSIVKHVLNAHQALLLVESELGTGSRFSCTFPADRAVSA